MRFLATVATVLLTAIAHLLSGGVGTISAQNEPADLILEGEVWMGDTGPSGA